MPNRNTKYRRCTPRPITVVFCSLLALPLIPASAAQTDLWQVGVAKTKITPEDQIWLAGYASRTAPSQRVLTDLWAKAMVLDAPDSQRAVLITLDLIGIDADLSRSICEQLHQKYGLERAQIALAVSHTHTGPVVSRNLATMHYLQLPPKYQALVDDYAKQLETTIIGLVGEAIESLQPARLRWGSGTAPFATNRRNNKEADVPRLRRQNRLEGPVDQSVPVLAAYSEEEQLIGIVFGYACHATVLSSNVVSGDYPGFAQLELEQRFPSAVALFWAGCGADQNPLPRRTEQLAHHYGRQLATAVESVLLTHEMHEIQPALKTRFRFIGLPLGKLPTRNQLQEQSLSSNPYEATRARFWLQHLSKGQSLPTEYAYPVQCWTLSDTVDWVFLAGEVVVDYAVRLKSERPANRTWITAYANDVMAYIPSERVLREGGYEGATSMIYYGLPTIWSQSLEQRIVDEVHRQLQENATSGQ